DALRAGAHRGRRDGRRRGPVGEPVLLLRLRDVPVLPEAAAEVAAGGPERQHARARIEVVERLLLDRVDAESGRAAVAREVHLAAEVLAHEAEPALPVGHLAEARAEVALDLATLEPVPPPSMNDSWVLHAMILPACSSSSSPDRRTTRRAPSALRRSSTR